MTTPNGVLSLRGFLEQWQILYGRLQEVKRLSDTSRDSKPPQEATKNVDHDDAESHDPFDCSDMTETTIYDKVDKSILPHFVQAWQQLDDRKISAPLVSTTGASTSSQNEGDESNSESPDDDVNFGDNTAQRPTKKRKLTTLIKKPKWFEKHVRFPDNFDYTNQQEDPPLAAPATMGDDTHQAQDRVISLVDPTQTTSYAHELWHLFDSIPTSSEIQDSLRENMDLPHTRAIHTDIVNLFASKSKQKSSQNQASSKKALGPSTFGLYALRMSDRHGYPTPLPGGHEMDFLQSTPVGTLVLEFWKRPFQDRAQPPSPDSSRMIVEFLGSQTLLDVHQTIVDMTQDEFWSRYVKKLAPNTTQRSCTEGNDQIHSTAGGDPEISESATDNHDPAGFFFIEGVFYTPEGKNNGQSEYTKPIQNWLLSGSRTQQEERAKYLGVTLNATTLLTTFDALPVKPMSQTSLQDIAVSFGKRYVHVFNGNVECSMFLVDFACRRNGTYAKPASTYPLLHDIWAPSSSVADCNACQRRVATLVTRSSCFLTSGQRALCQACARQLAVPREDLQRYSVWQQQCCGDE